MWYYVIAFVDWLTFYPEQMTLQKQAAHMSFHLMVSELTLGNNTRGSDIWRELGIISE